jgi:hypothetical protein
VRAFLFKGYFEWNVHPEPAQSVPRIAKVRMSDFFTLSAPQISLPKDGEPSGGMGEKFIANPNPVTGTGSMTVPSPPALDAMALVLSYLFLIKGCRSIWMLRIRCLHSFRR